MSDVKNTNDSKSKPPTILSFVKDKPNMCSLAGLFSAVTAIYFAILGIFPAAMMLLIWAVFFDWSDGVIARKMKNRSDTQRLFGGQLDTLIDIVSFGVCPAIILLSYGNFSPWFLPGAFCIVAAGVLRLSYFNVFNSTDESNYQGLSIDTNGIILTLLFTLDGLISHSIFVVLLYIVILALAFLNVAPIKTPKPSVKWYYAIIAYTIGITVFYSLKL